MVNKIVKCVQLGENLLYNNIGVAVKRKHFRFRTRGGRDGFGLTSPTPPPDGNNMSEMFELANLKS
jgi:hypothetical protein